MRGLTALGLELESAFGKIGDKLDEDSAVPLAWQICAIVWVFFPLRGEIDCIIWREVFLGKKNRDLLTKHAHNVLLL